jgi:phosphopentomutase
MSRFVFMVLDGVGAGALPDAAEYGDETASTLGNLARLVDLEIPLLQRLGLGNILPLRGVPPATHPLALPGRLAQRSRGKDTTTGHWEHMGAVTEQPFRTYPEGFPEEVLAPFRQAIGRDILGNKAASGTDIIAELGEEHLLTGRPIVYTSADSVFQIACHVDAVPLPQLYEWCVAAREILRGPHTVGRVIARPFAGEPGAFYRTKDRKDFSVEPPHATYLDLLVARGVSTLGIGKIFQIYAGRGVQEEMKVASNEENLELLLRLLRDGLEGLVMTNLVDFDMAWGHRNDLEGFARGLEAVDRALEEVLSLLGPDDRLLITADHGVDPTTVSTDHSREYVPLLYYPRPSGSPAAVYEGFMSDTGASAFESLTGETAGLPGVPIARLRPVRGWRRYPAAPVGPCGPVACAVGPDQAEEAGRWLREALGEAPEVAIILGSGLDRFAELVTAEAEVSYDEVPHWPAGAVAGHAGRLLVGAWRERRVAVLRGRAHAYEGFDRSEVQLSVRSLAHWGTPALVLTNAAGGLDPRLAPGQVALVGELLDLQEPAADGGPTRRTATEPSVANILGQRPHTYVALPGPHYETPAEVEVLRSIGGDMVGMSTAAEVAAAAEEGLRVAVFSVVTNPAGGTATADAQVHAEVLDVGRQTAPLLAARLETLLAYWPDSSAGRGEGEP